MQYHVEIALDTADNRVATPACHLALIAAMGDSSVEIVRNQENAVAMIYNKFVYVAQIARIQLKILATRCCQSPSDLASPTSDVD